MDEVRPSSAGADVSEVVFHVQETNLQTGQVRKVPASELATFLGQPAQVQNLQRMGLEQVVPKLPFSETEIKVGALFSF